MSDNIVWYFLIGCLIVAVASYFIKSLFKFVLIGFVVFILYNVGFVWGADDLNDKLGLHKLFEPNKSEQLQEQYDDYVSKREESKIIDPDAVQNNVLEAGQNLINKEN